MLFGAVLPSRKHAPPLDPMELSDRIEDHNQRQKGELHPLPLIIHPNNNTNPKKYQAVIFLISAKPAEFLKFPSQRPKNHTRLSQVCPHRPEAPTSSNFCLLKSQISSNSRLSRSFQISTRPCLSNGRGAATAAERAVGAKITNKLS